MRLKLVKQSEFLGTVCDFYVDEEDNIYMSRTQIGYALQYKQPQHSILVMHQRHRDRLDRFSIEISGSQFVTPIYKNKNTDKVFMYSERGIYEICRWSNQKVADEFNDWVYETIQSIKRNGYYIVSEKDSRWLGIREESKKARKYETGQIKLFVQYAKAQGSKNAERYYMVFTKLINEKVGLHGNQRDTIPQETLLELKSLETLLKMRIRKLMERDMPYKEIYQDIKMLVEEF